MPQTQHVKKSAKSNKPGKKVKAYYRTWQIGDDLVLETKLAKDGTLIFRVSPLGEHRKKVKGQERFFITARPGRWMGLHKLQIGKLFDHLVELEKQADEIQLYKDADSTPLRHHPFSGFDFSAVLVEGVEDALDPRGAEERRKARPKPKPKQKPRPEAVAKPKVEVRSRPRSQISNTQWAHDVALRMDTIRRKFKKITQEG